jgi:hypothetical protein
MAEITELVAAFRSGGCDAAYQLAAQGASQEEALKEMNALGIELFREGGDLEASLGVLEFVSGFANDSDPGAKGWAKAANFNIGAFTWPAWDDSPDNLTESHFEKGAKAAEANKLLAYELKKGDLPLARAEWLVAAHKLVKGAFGAAVDGFERAGRMAERAGELAEGRMNYAYKELARQLEQGQIDLNAIMSRFEEGDDAFFLDQVKFAAQFFAKDSA